MNTFLKLIVISVALSVVENLVCTASDAARPKPKPIKE